MNIPDMSLHVYSVYKENTANCYVVNNNHEEMPNIPSNVKVSHNATGFILTPSRKKVVYRLSCFQDEYL